VEGIQDQVNVALSGLEDRLTAPFDAPKHAVLLIAGLPRTGTTLLLQLLIACFEIGYVSNLAARFWLAPYVGLTLAKDLRRRATPGRRDFASELGATSGSNGPHEFGFFWNRWFPPGETHASVGEGPESLDFAKLRKEIAAMEDIAGMPMAFKNPIVFNMHMEKLAEALPTAFFLVCRRDPLFVAQSIIESRVKRYGDRSSWLGVKPAEYTWLRSLPPAEQVAGQVVYTQRHMERGLERLPCQRFLEIEYHDLCRTPEAQLAAIKNAIAGVGTPLKRTGFKPEPFEPADRIRLDPSDWEALRMALERFVESRDADCAGSQDAGPG